MIHLHREEHCWKYELNWDFPVKQRLQGAQLDSQLVRQSARLMEMQTLGPAN